MASWAAATPFGGGTLCVQTPWQRTGPSSGGPAPAMTDCSGVWSRDFRNAWAWANTTLPPGLDVYAQRLATTASRLRTNLLLSTR